MLLSKMDELLARAQIPFAPWRNDRDVRLECVIRQFKPDLVIALARRTMGDRIGTHFFGNLNLLFSD